MRRYLAACDDCGFRSWCKTEGLAQGALKRHKCATVRERLARRRRRIQRANASGEVRDCHHPHAHHQHGTRQAYVCDKCRCRPCRDAAAAYSREVARAKLYGRWDGWVDAQTVRDHVAALQAAGMGWKRAAEVAGLSSSSLYAVLYGRSDRRGGKPSLTVRRDIADKILAVQVDLADGACVPITGTRLRLRALVALGWSQAKLGRRLGITERNFTPLVSARGRSQVTVATAKKVTALYAELSMRLPPEAGHRDKISASRARNHARRLGWLPPLALDDDRLDDPTYDPHRHHAEADQAPELDHAAIHRRLHGDRKVALTKAEAREVVARLRADGWSYQRIEAHTGLKPDRYLPPREAAS